MLSGVEAVGIVGWRLLPVWVDRNVLKTPVFATHPTHTAIGMILVMIRGLVLIVRGIVKMLV
jgi:hypothetical protein